MIKRYEYVCVFLTGGVLYGLIEIAWRGYTHWSMIVAGGVCLLLIHLLNRKMRGGSLILKYIICCLAITSVELLSGLILNVWLGLGVWDYSALRGNIMGQVCPFFTLMWLLISPPACLVSDLIRGFFSILQKREQEDARTLKTQIKT